jgi:hypothetical protein
MVSIELVPKLIDYSAEAHGTQTLFAMEQALGKIGLIGLKSGPLFPENSKKLDRHSLSPQN